MREGRIRNEHIYLAIKELNEEMRFSICLLCKMGHISRAAYYKWLNHKESDNDKLNQKLAERLEELHEQHPGMGYRRLNDKLYHDVKIYVNDKRILRICRKKQIQSTLKYRYDDCTRPSRSPGFIVDNVLNREFHADNPNENGEPM